MVELPIGIRARALALLTVAMPACGSPPLVEELTPDQTCRQLIDTMTVRPAEDPERVASNGEVDSVSAGPPEDVRWVLPESVTMRQRLNAWCAQVGPAVIAWFGAAPAAPIDSLLVVSWNVHVGGGDLQRLVADIRDRATIADGPARDFVLVLQEAYREGDAVPSYTPGLPGGSGIEAVPASGPSRDIVEAARELGLYALYVPSMRNGQGRADRGNAILSTLPLDEPLAIELPISRQRRVVATAYVAGATSAGRPWRLQLSSVHLENDAEGWVSDERARVIQGEALLDGLPDAEVAVAAGDFNTWTRAQDEAVIAAMRSAFPDTPAFPAGPTYVRAFGILRRYLDYIFFRLPPDATARYRRLPDPYGSDHHPLVGWVVF